ncbi:MAG TPA: hypothetical protein VIG80_09935 [Bacillaceae bacterium]
MDYRQQMPGGAPGQQFFPGFPGDTGVNQRLNRLERRVERLEREVNRLNRRVTRLESQYGFPGRPEYETGTYY